jgi:hypothetical protein
VTTDRDILLDEIERMCCITGKTFEEREHTITVHGGPKYIFLADGTLKSIIKNGKAYGPDGEKRYVSPGEKARTK